MRSGFVLSLMMTWVGLCLQAGIAFTLVGPEVWAINEAATAGKGATVVWEQVNIFPRYIEFAYRIRITSAAGKEAVEFPTFSKECYEITGRTVYPDGRIAAFTDKDLSTKTRLKVGSVDVEQQVLVVPGVTDNCVVDLAWKESKPYWTTENRGFGNMDRILLSWRCPVQRVVVRVASSIAWVSAYHCGNGKLEDRRTVDGMNVYTMTDLPPIEEPPYSLPGARSDARILLFPLPHRLREAASRGQKPFWDAVGRFLKDYFESGIERGQAYGTLAGKLSNDLPESHLERAIELMKRLDGAIKNQSYPTHAEAARVTKKESTEKVDPKDLDEAAKRGWTTGEGMTFLFRALLQGVGIKPVMALVENREKAIYDQNLLCLDQFDEFLVGVETPAGDVVWFDPSRRFAMPGLIPEAYQGTAALMFNSVKWDATPIRVPVQAAPVNVTRYEYSLDLQPDEDRFHLQASFSGLPSIGNGKGSWLSSPRNRIAFWKSD